MSLNPLSLKRWWRTGLLLLGIVAVSFGAALTWWVHSVDQTWSPLIEPRLRSRQQLRSLRVLAQNSDGSDLWIGSFTSGRLEEREFFELKSIPPLLVQAIVVLEDPRFLEHGGFDVWGILRATLKNVLSLRYAQGGSTITQQLVKNVFLSSEKTLSRKAQELVLAALLEQRFSKDEILEAYINEVYLGQLGAIQIHGVGRASDYYFGKPVLELETHEVALLAAMIAGPGVFNPWRHPDRTRARRDRVITSLREAGFILGEEAVTAKAQPLPQRAQLVDGTRAPYLMDALRAHLINTRGESDVLAGGFDVRIGLDTGLQTLAETTLLGFRNQHQGLYQALILAGDPRSCEIRTYAGGTLYRESQLDRIRQSKRPSGSLVKPLLVSDLLESHKHSTHLAMLLKDEALEWRYGRQVWKPVNYDNKFRGLVSLRQTLEESLNVPLVALFQSIEPSGMLSDVLDPLRAMGLDVPPERALPSAILGAIDQSPWATLQSYLKFTRRALGWADTAADLGCELQFQKRSPDELATLSPLGGREDAYNALGARLTVSTLEGALRRGTSRSLGAKLPQDQAWAAKTGTSSDLRDSWFVAMSPELVVLSWVGRDDNQKTPFTGATGALPLAQPIIESATKKGSSWNWPSSEKLVWKIVDIELGCLLDDKTLLESTLSVPTSPPPGVFRLNGRNLRLELFIDDRLPETCPEA